MYKCIKRFLDIIICILVLIVLSPLLITIALLIMIESPGGAIFKQDRLGYKGKTFKIYKFRSMCVGAEQKGSGQYSFKGDPRVTKIGRIIRVTSIDELPQLVNIIKGDMSIIGPRPPLTYHPWPLEEYTDDQLKRFEVRPGVTGWSQIHGRKNILWEERFLYDKEYVENISFLLDIKILLITIGQVLIAKNNVNIDKTVEIGEKVVLKEG